MIRTFRNRLPLFAAVAGAVVLGAIATAGAESPRAVEVHNTAAEHGRIVSGSFKGIKANTGTVAITHESGKCILTLSDDFRIPDAPAPHWQIVDSHGNAYLLNLLKVKDGKYNQAIAVPAYIRDVAKAQIWCAFAEVNLGEAEFSSPVPNN